MTLLAISGLRVEFPTRRETFLAVRDVDLTVERGEIVGLVGESGAGKSTIGAAILGLLERPGRITAGTISLEGETISAVSAEAMRRIRGARVSMIFQDPLTSLNPLLTIERQLVETIALHDRENAGRAKARAVELLTAVGIPDPAERVAQYPHQFSGGMRQRVVIALALASKPDLIVADEPTTALDVSIQAQILKLIRKLCVEEQVGVILVTHDMGVIAETTDRVYVMYRGAVVESGATGEVLHRPAHAYTQSLMAAVPRPDVKLQRFPRLAYVAEAAKPFEKIDLAGHWLGAARSDAALEGPLLEVERLEMAFVTRRSLFPSGRRLFRAVDDVSFTVAEGETFGVVGESGSGKSTIARIVAGLHAPTGGRVRFAGRDVNALSGEEATAFRRQIQMIFQDPYSSLNPRMRVDAIVAEPIRHHGLASPGRETEEIVADLLEHVGLGRAAGRKYPHEFSGGQRQRISIARALATRPRFLICDEPTSALDVSIQAEILNLLKDLSEELRLTMMFISHDLPVVRQMCDRVAVMRHGALCEVAETETLFEAPAHPHTRELVALMPRLDRLRA